MALRTDPHAAALGDAVRRFMVEAGITQVRLAESTSLNIKTLRRRMSGSHPSFSYPEMRSVAAALDVSLPTLIQTAEDIYSRRQAR